MNPSTGRILNQCPCCGQRTLARRRKGDVCSVCLWQDDGQDDPVADEVWGGANGRWSLTQARQNFRECGAYDPRVGKDPANDKPPERRPVEPPAPAPAAPRPPLFTRRQQILLSIGALTVLLLSVAAYWLASGRLTREMLKDHGYYVWTRGNGGYQPQYLEAFARDPIFQRRFLGLPVDSLHAFFPLLYGGPRYDPDAYSAVNQGHTLPRFKPGTPVQSYRLGYSRGLTYCALVVDGEVRDFFFANR